MIPKGELFDAIVFFDRKKDWMVGWGSNQS